MKEMEGNQSEQQPGGHNSESEQIHSQYFESSLKAATNEIPGKIDDLRNIFESVDEQMVENWAQFTPEGFPGVEIPLARLSVNKLVKDCFGLDENTDPTKTSDRSKYYFMFGGYAQPPSGHPFTQGDIVIDRAINEIPGVVRPVREKVLPPRVEIYSLGSPNGFGGKVTGEWTRQLKIKGFDLYGQVYASAIVKQLPKDFDPKTVRIILQGMSMGCANAERTAHYLKDFGIEAELLLDNPVGLFESDARNTIQVKSGFVLEGLAKIRPIIAEAAAEKKFILAMKARFKGLGIDGEDTPEQSHIKKEAAGIDRFWLGKKSPINFSESKAFIRRGTGDLTTYSFGFRRSALRQQELRTESGQVPIGVNLVERHGKVREFAIGASHFMNRNRFSKWAKMIDYARRITEPLERKSD